jgi:GAF domain-containing protein/CheY-like chemotaxis protein
VGHGDHQPLEAPPGRGAPLKRPPLALLAVCLALTGLWGAGGVVLFRQLSDRHATTVAETVAGLRTRVADARAQLSREASLLARDSAVVEAASRRDWATLARAAPPRLRSPALDRLADLVLIVDAGGATLAQIPATPPIGFAELRAPGAAPSTSPGSERTPDVGAFAVAGGRAWLLASARIDDPSGRAGAGGLVVLGRQLERLETQAAGGPAPSHLVWTVADGVRASTLSGLAPAAWPAAVGSGRVSVDGEGWTVRPIESTKEAILWALVREAPLRAERRRLWEALIGSFVLAGAGCATAAWAVTRRRDRRRGAESPEDRRARILETLAETSPVVGDTDPAGAAARTLEAVCAATGMDAGLVYRLEAAPKTLVLIAQRGLDDAQIERARVRPADGDHVGEAMRTGRAAVAPPDPTAPARPREPRAVDGYQTLLALPIRAGGDRWGAMVLASIAARGFDGEELRLLEAAAQQVGVGVARGALLAETQEKSRRLETLTRLAQMLTATLSVEEVPQRVVDAAVEVFGSSVSRLWLVDEDGVTLSLRASAGAQSSVEGLTRLRVGEGLMGGVVAARAPVVVRDATQDPRTRNVERIRAEGSVSVAGVPLLLGDRVLGALSIAVRVDHDYTTEELGLLQSLANQAAIALENARLFADERARRAHLAALLEINKKIGALAPTETLLSSIAEEAARLLDVDNAGFRLVEGDELVLAGLAGSAAETMVRPRIKTNESLSGRVVAAGRTLVLDAESASEFIIPEHLAADRRLGYTTLLGVPLQFGNRTIGVLTFRARRPFTARDQELAEAFAGQAAVAIEHSRLYRQTTRQAERMTALAEIGRVLSETLDPDLVGQRSADRVRALLDVESAALYRLVPDSGDLVALAVSGAAGQTFGRDVVFARGTGAAGLAVRDRAPVVSADLLADPRITLAPEMRARVEAAGYRAVLAVPLLVQDRVIGALGVGDHAGRIFQADEIHLARMFGDQVGLALENARLYAEAMRRRREAEELARLAQTLTESLDVEAVGERIVESVLPLFAARASALRLLQPDGSLVALAMGGDSRPMFRRGHAIPAGVGASGRAVAEGRPIASADIFNDPEIVVTEEIDPSVRGSLLAVPLRAKGRIIGALSVADLVGRVFTEPEAALLQAVGDQAALALENARLFSAETSRRVQIATLAEMERELAAELKRDRLLTMIVEQATRFFAANGAMYLLEDDGTLVPRKWTEKGTFADVRLEIGQGLVGACAERGQGLVVDDYPESPYALSRWTALDVRRAMAHPLSIGDRLLGVLAMNRTGDDAAPFTQEDLNLLQSFAARAAVALENARLYEVLEVRAIRLRTLARLNQLITGSLQTGDVLGEIARAAVALMDAPVVMFWAADEGAETLEVRAVSDSKFDLAVGRRTLRFGEGGPGWVAQHRQTLNVADVHGDPRFVAREWRQLHGFRSFAGIPIVLRGGLLGVLTLDGRKPFRFGPEDQDLLENFVAQAAIALENARLYSETARRLEETRALLDVAALLNSTLDSRQLLKRVAMKIAQVCQVDRCTLELWDGDRVVPLMSQFADGRQAPELWTRFLDQSPYPPREIPAHARAIETRRPVLIHDTAGTDQIPQEWIDVYGLKSYMVVPLIRQDQVIGVMNLDHAERPARFQPWQEELATAIAGQLALSLENSRLYTEAQERLRETTALLAVSRALSRPGASEDVMRTVAREIAHAFEADMVGAYFLDARKESLVPLAGYHVPKHLVETLLRRPMQLARFPGLLSAWREGRALWSGDVHHDPRFDPEWADALPPHSVLFASTTAHGEPIGGLFLVWWRTGRVFPPAEIRLIEGVAAQVGLALENADLSRQTQLKLAETETLLSVSRALSSTLDLEALVRHCLRSVTRAVDADASGLWMLAEDGESLDPLVGYHIPPAVLAAVRSVRLSITRHAFYAEAARTRRPVYSLDAMEDPRVPAVLRQAAPHRSQLFVPIVANERLLGGFAVVWWDRVREFSASDLALMEAIASQASVAVEHARLFEENRRQVEELSVLHALSRAVTGQLDRAALFEAIQQHIARLLDVRNMVIALRNEYRDEIEVALRVSDGLPDPRVPLRYPSRGADLMSVILETGHALRTDDYAAECARRGVRPVAASADLRHWLGVPLTAGDAVLGVLVLRGAARPFSAGDERLLGNIAHLAALALRSAELFEQRTRAYGELASAQDQLVRTEKLRALGEMASGVAHDFNNLLASILGRAQLLLRRVQDPQQRNWLQVIERSALDGAQTVRRLQEFTRIRRDAPLVAVDLDQVVREALEITQSRWREEAASRGIVVDVRMSLAAPGPVAGDPSELREAMTNLILNAVDAMPHGGTLTLTTERGGDRIQMTVADTGVGMSQAVREKIFDPFFTTKGPQGTGLGLSMTYGILARHGARIAVESEEGRGSTFRLSFPWSEPPRVSPAATAGTAAPSTSLRCLVVDDEEVVATVLGDMLESGGHTAVVLLDGADAIARFQAERFDAVFTDLAMPRVTGWQVARAVKDVAPEVPVFLVTGFGVELSAEERRGRGVDAVLAKPVQIAHVLEALAEVGRRLGQTSRTEGH